MCAIDETRIRLKISGQRVDPRRLPDVLVTTIARTFSDLENDPYAVLATYAYTFGGLKINDIKDMIILSDRSGTRKASREYIRQKIVTTFHRIQQNYLLEHGAGNVSPIYHDRNLDPAEIAGLEDRYRELFEEDIEDANEDQGKETEATGVIIPTTPKPKPKPIIPLSPKEEEEEDKTTTGSDSKGPADQPVHDDRPRNPKTWLVRVTSRLFGRKS